MSQEMLHGPVFVCETGMTYERKVIENWFESHSSDPNTGLELGTKKQLAPNVVLRKMIAQWLDDEKKQAGV